MNDAGEMRTVKARSVVIDGVEWDLTLVRDEGQWVVRATTVFGEGPEPLHTADEAEAFDAFENFEHHVRGARPEDGE